MGLYDELSKYTSTALLRTALNAARNDVDKREGGILYDALAPLCFVVAQLIQQLKVVLHNTEIQTAQGEYLDRVASQYAITRRAATASVRLAQADPVDCVITVGTAFKTTNGLGLLWEVTANNGDGIYTLTCQTAGADGGRDYGALDAVEPLADLNSLVFTQTLNEGLDVESDDDFRIRIWQEIQRKSYGGNFADYMTWVFNDFAVSPNGAAITGISFFPVWNGGGTVKIVPFVSNSSTGELFTEPPQLVLDNLKAFIDPEPDEGLGAGVAPVGHSVTIEAPDIADWHITAEVELYAGQTLTEDIINDARADVMAAIDEARKDALTLADGEFPRANEYIFKVYALDITKAITAGGRFDNAKNVRINGDLLDDNHPISWPQTATNHKMARLASLTLTEA